MQNRTVIRTALDKFFDNALVETIASFVNFCNKPQHYTPDTLKFSQNLPLNKMNGVEHSFGQIIKR